MVELNEKGHDPKLVSALRRLVERLEVTPEPLRGPFLVEGLKPFLPLSALPAPDDGLVERLRYRVENPSAWDTFDQGGSDLIAEAATALRSKDEQIERLTRIIDVMGKICDEKSLATDAAEQQVQKLSAENERLRDAIRQLGDKI